MRTAIGRGHRKKRGGMAARQGEEISATDPCLPQVVHWLKGRGLSSHLHVSVRRGKNDFFTSERRISPFSIIARNAFPWVTVTNKGSRGLTFMM